MNVQWAASVAKPGVSKWGVKGEDAGRVHPLPVRGPGAMPPEKIQITDARRRVLAHFSDKNQYIDACVYACKLRKIFQITYVCNAACRG
jgi:hypothetical protein